MSIAGGLGYVAGTLLGHLQQFFNALLLLRL